MVKKTKFWIKVGERAYKRGKNDYAGMSGDIEWNHYQFRVQFHGIANNESLANFNLNRCNIYPK